MENAVVKIDGRIISAGAILPSEALTPTIAVGSSWIDVALMTKNIAEEYSAVGLLSSS